MTQKKIDADFYYQLRNVAKFNPHMNCVLSLHRITEYENDLSIRYGFITITKAIDRLTKYLRQVKLDTHTYNYLRKRLSNLGYLPPNYLINDANLFDIQHKLQMLTINDIIEETQLSH